MKFRLGGCLEFRLWSRLIMLAVNPDWWVSKGTFLKEVVSVPIVLSAPDDSDSLLANGGKIEYAF